MKLNQLIPVDLTRLAGMATLTLLIAFTSIGICNAQDGEKAVADPESEVSQLLTSLNDHMQEGEWAEAKALMTDEAWDTYCSRLVQRCASMTKIEINIDIPGLNEAQEAVEEVLEKYGLEDVEVKDGITLKIDGQGDDEEADDDEEDEEDEGEQDGDEEKVDSVLTALDKGGKRMEIVEALYEANGLSPFNLSLFNGDVKEVEVEAKDMEVTLIAKIEPKVQQSDGSDGIQIKMMSPPMIVLIQKVDGEFKYGGLDMRRTAEEAKNFSPRGDGPRTDF